MGPFERLVEEQVTEAISNKQRAEIEVLTGATWDWHDRRISQRQWLSAVSAICNDAEIARLRAIPQYTPRDKLRDAVAKAYLGQ